MRFRSLTAVAVLFLFGAGMLAGCGGSSDSGAGEVSKQMDMVTVNWIEGLAMTYTQEHILENRYDMTVDVREVQGGGIAFSSVASGDRDFFNEAWLPTTHKDPWAKNKEKSQKLGYTYKGTSIGLAVPTYMDVDTIPDLTKYRDELDGVINGIESGAAINTQTRKTLETYGIDGFSVQAASGPATWQALKSAVDNKKPIVVTGWKPHWKWSVYDLKYVNGATTGHNVEIWGEAEDIFTIVGNDFIEKFPREVVCFLQEFETNDEQIGSLMNAFRNRGDNTSKEKAAAQWIENNPDHVDQWTSQAKECANSDKELEYLPDDASFSSK